jgi:transcriptional regulator with GAF, ATPase, and Fis domain
MMVKENEFFRQATMQICSSLDMEAALLRSMQYIRHVIPTDEMNLHLYEKEFSGIRTVLSVTEDGIKKLDLLSPLSMEAKLCLERTIRQEVRVRVVHRAEADPVSGEMLEFIGKPDSSILVMRLEIEGEMLGAITLRAEGEGRYTKEHARLLSLLSNPFTMALANSLRYREMLGLKNMLAEDDTFLHQKLLGISDDEIIGKDSGLKGVMDLARQVAPLNSPVLLLGETGVGKEVIANAIHYSSPRRNGPYIKVNCGGIPETLADSLLFGHEKGAFTGAVARKRGRFEQAHRGTIFLDEIGELPPHVQARMLRVIQYNEIERVGGAEPIQVEIRIIASTHREMEHLVKTGKFRDDLWFRLNVFPITIPPLRERKGDIPDLVFYFVRQRSREMKLGTLPELSPGSIQMLLDYDWPGNIRELENVIERALILNRNGPLRFDNLNLNPGRTTGSFRPSNDHETLNLDDVMCRHIEEVLNRTGGKINGPLGAAKILGIHPNTLRNRLIKLSIPYGRKRLISKSTPNKA